MWSKDWARFVNPPDSTGAWQRFRSLRDSRQQLNHPVGVPHVRTGVARIPTTQYQRQPRVRLSLKESRMKSLNATNLDRKSGIRGPKTKFFECFPCPSRKSARQVSGDT